MFSFFSLYYNNSCQSFIVTCPVRLVFQLPSTGGMMPISQVMVTRLYEYATSDDWIRFGMEIVVLLFVLWWLIHEILTIKRGPKVRFTLLLFF